VCYAYFGEKGIELFILTTPIRLDNNDLPIKKSLDLILKITKLLKNFRFIFPKIVPSVFAEIINKTHIVFLFPNRVNSWSPNIRKDKF
jgi:hypothetical protein